MLINSLTCLVSLSVSSNFLQIINILPKPSAFPTFNKWFCILMLGKTEDILSVNLILSLLPPVTHETCLISYSVLTSFPSVSEFGLCLPYSRLAFLLCIWSCPIISVGSYFVSSFFFLYLQLLSLSSVCKYNQLLFDFDFACTFQFFSYLSFKEHMQLPLFPYFC